jgi:hypothetical protein
MSITKLEFIKDDAKKIGAFIKDAGTIYQKRDEYLHMAAGMSFFHAQQHGDAVFIQRFYDVLTKGHQNMFRVWLGKLATYEVDEKRDCWLGFSSGKFFVKGSTENIRKSQYDPEDLLALDMFTKREKTAAEKTADELLADLIKATRASAERVEKRWKDAGLAMPTVLADALNALETYGKKA